MTNNALIVSLVISGIALISSAFLWWNMYRFNQLKRTFFAGNQGRDLEEVIKSMVEQMRYLEATQIEAATHTKAIYNQLQLGVQKVGLVRFNPFGDSGGNLSFSLALLDAYNTGVIITSMYGREQNRIYTKRIVNGNSESQLNKEELGAVASANGQSSE
jgi:hypothetical protein